MNWQRGLKLWRQGLALRVIAKELGCSHQAVASYAAKHKWPPRVQRRWIVAAR